MTGGSGISHSERFDDPIRQSGGWMHGTQAWVALPEAQEKIEPSFVHHGAEDLPVFGEPGVSARLIAGRAFGLTNPV
jgi:redox-sensitive bicupin YhaK (pirin superfamily)